MGRGVGSPAGGGAICGGGPLVGSGFAGSELERVIQRDGHFIVAPSGALAEGNIDKKCPAAHVPLENIIVRRMLAALGIKI